MFEEAHGGRSKTTKFNHETDFGSDFGGSVETDETGDIDNGRMRMRLTKIDNMEVIRHSLNIDGLYGGLNNSLDKNCTELEKILDNSSDRLETRQMVVALAREAILAKKKMEAQMKIDETKKQKEDERRASALGSSLDIGELLNMDVKEFSSAIKKEEGSDVEGDGSDSSFSG